MNSCVARPEWVKRWGFEITATPIRRGVWGLRNGGYLIRACVLDPIGKSRDLMRALHDATLEEAVARRAQLQSCVQAPPSEQDALPPLWMEFAFSLLTEKVNEGRIKSAKTREKWACTLARLAPSIGGLYIDEVTTQRLAEWRSNTAQWIASGMPSLRPRDRGKLIPLAPDTANGWMSILKVVCAEMTVRFDLPRDPAARMKTFPKVDTYTEEQPNALTPEEGARFLAKLKELFPQHFAMVVLGCVIGARPSSLRPIRWRGPNADLLWNVDGHGEGTLLLRRSHTRRQEVMETTKTGKKQKLPLTPDVMAILEEHVKSQEGAMAKSDLLFPSITGEIRSCSGLDKPFRAVIHALGWELKVTPRAMRRTFQDVTRDELVPDVITRAISGHRTQSMQEHYSTARRKEMLAAIQRVATALLPQTPSVVVAATPEVDDRCADSPKAQCSR